MRARRLKQVFLEQLISTFTKDGQFKQRTFAFGARESLLHKNLSSTSALESNLLVCKNKTESVSHSKKSLPNGKRLTSKVAQSQVLGKVKDFLGVISEANKHLQQDCKDNSQNYDIEALTGTESEAIEMDLMLGIADLHTPEAIAAAEFAISNGQPLVPLDSDSSGTGTESEGTSDADGNDEANSDDDNYDDDDKPLKHKTSKFSSDGSRQAVGKNGLKKRPKIVEIS